MYNNNDKMLEGALLLVCSLHWFRNFSLNMVISILFFIQIKFLQIINVERYLWVKQFCHFPWKYNFLNPIQTWIKCHMNGCLFRFPFKSGFNLSKVLAYRAYSCYFMCAIVAHMRLPFFKKQTKIVSRIGLAYQWKIIISSAANYLTVAREHKMDPWSAPKMTKHNKIRRVIAILTLSHFLAEVIQTVNILHRI